MRDWRFAIAPMPLYQLLSVVSTPSCLCTLLDDRVKTQMSVGESATISGHWLRILQRSI